MGVRLPALLLSWRCVVVCERERARAYVRACVRAEGNVARQLDGGVHDADNVRTQGEVAVDRQVRVRVRERESDIE